MKEIRDALAAFWGGLWDRSKQPGVPIKAFPADCAVEYGAGKAASGEPPDFPYITYEIARPAFTDFDILSASVWHRGTSWGLVDDVLRQAAERIPESGALLRWGSEGLTGGGALWLLRNNPFMQPLNDPDDKMIKRGIIRVVIKNYLL